MALAAQFQWQMLAQIESQIPSEPANLTQNKAEIIKMKMKTDADVERANIAALSAHHGQRVTLETEAMKGLTALHKEKMASESRNQNSPSQD